MMPTIFKPCQSLPQEGGSSSSSGSEKFLAAVTPPAPMTPSLASRLVSLPGSHMQARLWQTSFSDQAARPPHLKHLAPLTVHLMPSRPGAGTSAAEGPQGGCSSSWAASWVSMWLKPAAASCWSKDREALASCEATHASRERSSCARVQDRAPLSPSAHSAIIWARTSSPACTGSCPNPCCISAKDTTPSPSASTSEKRRRIFSPYARMSDRIELEL
mmetsp:Transcript_142012/g.441575  ORF Transcript_142012/g.441575 Transcript_142012/m.441575 type:complete len:217 (+) Transcript_142012:1124-1774(+)